MRDRIIGSGKVSTIVGLVASAAISGAAGYFQQSGGNTTSWQPYAAAAGVAVAGALWQRKAK